MESKSPVRTALRRPLNQKDHFVPCDIMSAAGLAVQSEARSRLMNRWFLIRNSMLTLPAWEHTEALAQACMIYLSLVGYLMGYEVARRESDACQIDRKSLCPDKLETVWQRSAAVRFGILWRSPPSWCLAR